MDRRITYTKAAMRAIRRLPGDVAATIRAKIEQLAADPASLANNVTALKGTDFLRLRVGNYRVIYRIDLVMLEIVDAGHRGAVYN